MGVRSSRPSSICDFWTFEVSKNLIQNVYDNITSNHIQYCVLKKKNYNGV
jgi:hypothetical protein